MVRMAQHSFQPPFLVQALIGIGACGECWACTGTVEPCSALGFLCPCFFDEGE
jgi:hypothetical protein